tara:strand:- start:41060 stop:41359 length:300 start_codon:yes stop_codon:yes gene_type:complete
MTTEEIEKLFLEEVNKEEFRKRKDFTKQHKYNYRNRTTKVGLMIEVLHKIGAINITKTENNIPLKSDIPLFNGEEIKVYESKYVDHAQLLVPEGFLEKD